MRASYKVFPRVFKVTLSSGGNNKSNKTHLIRFDREKTEFFLRFTRQKYNKMTH